MLMLFLECIQNATSDSSGNEITLARRIEHILQKKPGNGGVSLQLAQERKRTLEDRDSDPRPRKRSRTGWRPHAMTESKSEQSRKRSVMFRKSNGSGPRTQKRFRVVR